MRKVILNDIIDIISGGTPKTNIKEYWNDGTIGWLSINDFNNNQRKIFKSSKYITQKALKESNTKVLDIDDIIISARGTVGVLAQIGTPLAFNQSCFGLKGKKDIVDNTYLYYALTNYVSNIKKRGQGSVFNTINLDSFKLMEISIEEDVNCQKQIASILSQLDDKIELNQNINEELDGMATAIYDYWFVQFDFPDKNGKPYKSSGGKMIYNKALNRPIPEGWNAKSLDYFTATDKSGDWGKEQAEGNYTSKVECIRGADINGINGKGDVKTPTRFILEKNEHKILAPNDLVIEISGGSPTQSTGRLACITAEVSERFENPLICSNFCKAVSLISEEVVFYFTHSWNRAYDNGVFFGFEGKTSGIKNLLFDSLVSHYQIPLPDKNLLVQFQETVSLFEKQKQTNLKQNQELVALRDWLLPMLMNGQVKVAKALKTDDVVPTMA